LCRWWRGRPRWRRREWWWRWWLESRKPVARACIS
jgi:hypothetical protein